MASISVELNQQQVEQVYSLLADVKHGAQRAIRASLNRTLDGAIALTAKKIGEKTTLKAKLIKDNITKQRATNYQFGAVMRITSGRMPLAAFSTNPSAANFQAGGRGNGVSVKVWRDQSPVRFRHAFFAVMPNGYIGLFQRRGRERLHIDELKGPFLSSIYEQTPGLAHEVETTSAERLQRELAHQIDYLLGLNNG